MNTSQSKKYIAALYLRLSKDDEGTDESSSIKNQRKMLVSYAKEKGYIVYDEYVDDGWSGTNFERPDFKRMICDIEAKKVNLVITKDLSRLGREYIMTGQYTEIYFPSKGVRYIAIDDGYDSESPYTDIAPFKNVVNEMYARDISKKIRSAFTSKMKEGEYIGNFAPYGYKKDPKNKNHLLIDEEVAPIVKEIFEMAANGITPLSIADYLNEKGIPTRMMYRCKKNPQLDKDKFVFEEEWRGNQIRQILRSVVYIGDTAQRKTRKVSFKSNLVIINSPEDWIIVHGTHEPIVDKETFEAANHHIQSRFSPKTGNFSNVFSGLVKCMDCGHCMSAAPSRKKGSICNLACNTYKSYGAKQCSNHFIDYTVLYNIVKKALREQLILSEQDKSELFLELQQDLERKQNRKDGLSELEKLKQRSKELDGIIERLYDDNFKGIISITRFQKLLSKYETEAQEIDKKMDFLSKRLSQSEEQNSMKAYERFLELLRQYTDFEELTPKLLYDLIDRIEVAQGHYEKTEHGLVKYQQVKIYFRFIGKAITKEIVL